MGEEKELLTILERMEQQEKKKLKDMEEWEKRPLKDKLRPTFMKKQTSITTEIINKRWIVKGNIEGLVEEFLEDYVNEKVKNLIEFMKIKGFVKRDKLIPKEFIVDNK